MNKQDAQKFIIAGIYKVSKPYYIKDFSDISGVNDLIEDIKKVAGVESVTVADKSTEKMKDLDGDEVAINKFTLHITTKFGYLGATISCFPQNNNSSYNIVVSAWQKSELVKESLNEGIADDVKEKLYEALKKVKNQEDLGKFIRRAAILGVSALTIIQMITCCFQLNNTERENMLAMIEDGNIPYEYYMEHYDEFNKLYAEYYGTDEDEDEDVQSKPDWEWMNVDATVTVYNATSNQCNKDVQHTASMFQLDLNNPQKHRIIAMDRGMMEEYGFKYGDLVKLQGVGKYDGVYQLQDTMNKRYNNDNKIDILVNGDTIYGKWSDVQVFKLKNPEQWAAKLKKENNMLPAKNQSQIDAKQNRK